jgi:hypothetical protein
VRRYLSARANDQINNKKEVLRRQILARTDAAGLVNVTRLDAHLAS